MLRKLAVFFLFGAFVITEAQSENSQEVYVVPQGYGITSLRELDGASVCLTKPHYAELVNNLASSFRMSLEQKNASFEGFFSGRCDVLIVDASCFAAQDEHIDYDVFNHKDEKVRISYKVNESRLAQKDCKGLTAEKQSTNLASAAGTQANNVSKESKEATNINRDIENLKSANGFENATFFAALRDGDAHLLPQVTCENYHSLVASESKFPLRVVYRRVGQQSLKIRFWPNSSCKQDYCQDETFLNPNLGYKIDNRGISIETRLSKPPNPSFGKQTERYVTYTAESSIGAGTETGRYLFCRQ